MKLQRAVIALLILLAGLVAACTPGHLGSNIIAFIRNGQLWTIDPNGANAFAIVAQKTPVVGYSWSPTHQLLSFRALDATFAKTPTARQLPAHSMSGLISDVPGTENTIGVDGGTPISIAFSSPDVQYSNTIWNSTGTRLLFRQTPKITPRNPDEALWWVSQNDQPGGIAIKSLPGSYSIPSLSYRNNMAIGNSSAGVFTTTIAGTNLHYLVHQPLPGHPLPASLERILWQPGHRDASILYAISSSSQQQFSSGTFKVQLIQRTMSRQTTTLATCACTQFAWSPDGNALLYSTGSTYTILDIIHHSSFSIEGESDSVPYWSPDSHFLLLDGLHTLTLVQVAQHQQRVLLSDGSTLTQQQTATPLPAINALLQPVANSIWASDSRHFLFLTHDRLLWQGQPLKSGKGLYTVAIDTTGHPQGSPTLVDTGNDSQAGWTYEDANTAFLY